MLFELQGMLAEIAGLPRCVAMHPRSRAQGELTALLTAAAWFRHKGKIGVEFCFRRVRMGRIRPAQLWRDLNVFS